MAVPFSVEKGLEKTKNLRTRNRKDEYKYVLKHVQEKKKKATSRKQLSQYFDTIVFLGINFPSCLLVIKEF